MIVLPEQQASIINDEMLSSALSRAINISVLKALAFILAAEAENLQKLTLQTKDLDVDFYEEVRKFECNLIERALILTGGSQLKAARMLGLNKSTLNAKIKLYNISIKVVTQAQPALSSSSLIFTSSIQRSVNVKAR